MEMTLAKALKYKKRLVERIAKLDAQVIRTNSVLAGNEREVVVADALTERRQLIEHLVDVKSAIFTANKDIQATIFLISELKGTITQLKAIPTRHGKEVVGYRDTESLYEAEIKQPQIDKMVNSLEAEIDAGQEKIDAYNHRTTITIDTLD